MSGPPRHLPGPAPAGGSPAEAAFAEQRGPLLRYAARLLGDADLARDVVQDTFARFISRPPAETEGHAVEWLYTACRNRALDIRRKESRRRFFPDGSGEGLAGGEPRPGAALERAETREILLAAVNRLPPNQQEVVRLKFQNGFRYEEIARITGLSVGNVGFLLHTAIARLRRDWTRAESDGFSPSHQP